MTNLSQDRKFCHVYLLYSCTEVGEKSNETDFLFTKGFIFFKHQCHPLQNSSLWQLHTDGEVVPTFGSNAGSLQPVWSSACPLHSFGCFLKSRNDVL